MSAEEEKKRAEVESHKREAIRLADDIFKIVQKKEFIESTDAETRHNMLISKFPSFANAYPIILRYMARDICYNARAFRQFLDRLERDPGSGMEGFITCQAFYAKYLYIEDCKDKGLHWSGKKAKQIYDLELQHMNAFIKKVKDEEKKSKNEFAEEKERHLEEKRKELLDFLNVAVPYKGPIDNIAEGKQEQEQEKEHPTPTSTSTSVAPAVHRSVLDDIDYRKLNYGQMLQYYRSLRELEEEYIDLLLQANEHIHELEAARDRKARRLARKQLTPEQQEWLQGTCVAPIKSTKNKTKAKTMAKALPTPAAKTVAVA